MTKKQFEAVSTAGKILKEKGIKKLTLCSFGTYYQYEMAGTRIRPDILDVYEEEKLTEEEAENLIELLTFIDDEDFIYKKLGFPDEGQNRLVLTDKGKLEQETFRI